MRNHRGIVLCCYVATEWDNFLVAPCKCMAEMPLNMKTALSEECQVPSGHTLKMTLHKDPPSPILISQRWKSSSVPHSHFLLSKSERSLEPTVWLGAHGGGKRLSGLLDPELGMVAIHHVGLRKLGPLEEQGPLTVYAVSPFLSLHLSPTFFDSLTM